MGGVKLGDDNLSDKERAFLLEWIVDGDGTKAAMKVYNCKKKVTASNLASKTLRRPRVRKALQILLDKADPNRIKLRKLDILKNLSLSLNRNLHDLATVCPAVRKLPPEVFPYIAGFDVEQFHDDPEHPDLVTRDKIRIRLSPIGEDRDQALRVRGLYAPSKNLNASMTGTPSDWSALLKAVEEEAEAEAMKEKSAEPKALACKPKKEGGERLK
jgi:hypothetical protein